jgi:acetylornithine deacetylase/succinyl-diaminopimelate desuccinylase-like protein
MGPRGGAAHSTEEYLELSDLPQRFALFMEVLGRLPGAAFPHAGENEGRES